MAEYYPLLARAVAGLRDAPAAQRTAIYERARQALLGQLRSMQPAVPEESIQRESTALDEAIARVEAELRPAPAPAAEPPAAAAPREAGLSPRETGASPPAPAEAPAQPPAPPPVQAPAPPLVPPPVRAAEAPVQAPAPAPVVAVAPGPAMPPRATPARPAAEALSRLVAERAPTPGQAAKADDEEPAGRRAPLPSAPRLQVPSFTDALEAAGEAGDAERPAGEEAGQTLAGDAAPPRDEPARPPAPRHEERERFNPRMLILAGVACLVVAAIAYAAWRLRDKPEALARSRAAMLAAQQAEQQNPAKIVNRVDTGASAPAPSARGAAPADGAGVVVPAPTGADTARAPAPAASAPASNAPATPATPAAADNAVPAAEPASPPSAAASPAPAPDAGVPVAQRAALLVDAPDEPSKIKTYVGTAVWTAGTTSPAPGQPSSRTVHADVEVPEAGLKLTLVFQKNLEPQFPASHTLELRFTMQPNSPVGTIKQINVPQMRRDDSPAGDALSGLPVTITDNYFLVGLQRGGDAVARNLDLIRTRNWFDVPILLGSGKVAKITFEKGTSGAQLVDDTINSWQ